MCHNGIHSRSDVEVSVVFLSLTWIECWYHPVYGFRGRPPAFCVQEVSTEKRNPFSRRKAHPRRRDINDRITRTIQSCRCSRFIVQYQICTSIRWTCGQHSRYLTGMRGLDFFRAEAEAEAVLKVGLGAPGPLRRKGQRSGGRVSRALISFGDSVLQFDIFLQGLTVTADSRPTLNLARTSRKQKGGKAENTSVADPI